MMVMRASSKMGQVAGWGGHTLDGEHPQGSRIGEQSLAAVRARAVSVSASFARGVVRWPTASARRTRTAASDRSGVHGLAHVSRAASLAVKGPRGVERGGGLRASLLSRCARGFGPITKRLQPTGRGAASFPPQLDEPRPAAEAHVVSQKGFLQ